jgi:hypothetical protein
MTEIKQREWSWRRGLIDCLAVSVDLQISVQERTWEALGYTQQVVDNLFMKTDLREYVEITTTRHV